MGIPRKGISLLTDNSIKLEVKSIFLAGFSLNYFQILSALLNTIIQFLEGLKRKKTQPEFILLMLIKLIR